MFQVLQVGLLVHFAHVDESGAGEDTKTDFHLQLVQPTGK